MKIKIFYKQVNFYIAACAFVLILAALGLYAGNCASEFNGGVVSGAVVAGDAAALVLVAVALAGGVAEYFLQGKPLPAAIVEYRRFCLYAALLALIYSFLTGILAEYSLLGTILYPLVSGTVGDPVDAVLSGSYFAQLGCILAALVCVVVAALMQKSGFYKSKIVSASTAAGQCAGEKK